MMKLEEFLNIYYNVCVRVYIGRAAVQGNGADIIPLLDKSYLDSEVKRVDIKHRISYL